MKKRLFCLFIMVAFALVTIGCSSPADNIYDILEETVAKESDFEKQQAPMMELEIEEIALFDEIMELGMKEFETIVELANQALANLDQREELLNKEKAALEQSQLEFEKINEQIDDMKDGTLKNSAIELKKLMQDRFDSYDNLYEAYLNGLNEDRKIYSLVQNEDLELESLEKQIEASNKAYESVFEFNDIFNEKTEQFNKAKLEFYEEAGFKIQTDTEE